MAQQNLSDVKVVVAPKNFTGRDVSELTGLPDSWQAGTLVIDLKETVSIDSRGIGRLFIASAESRKSGKTLVLKNPCTAIIEMFAATGLDLVFNVETSEGIESARPDIFDINNDLRLEITEENLNSVCVFHLSGVMNHPAGSRYFRRRFLTAMASFDKILVNFEKLTFFDSLSVSVILTMNKLLKYTGGSMRLCTANEMVSDLFSTLAIKQVVPVFGDMTLAMAEWK